MLGWLGLLVIPAVAGPGSRWDGVDADVVVRVVVDAEPAAVTATLADLGRASTLFEPSCLARWAVGVPESGVGARARVTYTPSWMSRRLTLVVTDAVPGEQVVWDHEGDRGFETRFVVSPTPDGTEIVMETPLLPPPWPVRELYHLKVKPAWEACFTAALSKLGDASVR
jgi:hypothetical protein